MGPLSRDFDPVRCGYCRRDVDDHALPASSPAFFESCRVVISTSAGGVFWRYAPGVICTLTWPA